HRGGRALVGRHLPGRGPRVRRRGNCRPAAHARHPPAGRRGNGDEYPAGAGAPVHERVTLRPTDAAEAARVAMTYGPRGAEMDCTECSPRSTPGTSMRNAFRIALPGLLLLPEIGRASCRASGVTGETAAA